MILKEEKSRKPGSCHGRFASIEHINRKRERRQGAPNIIVLAHAICNNARESGINHNTGSKKMGKIGL
jgi:hypothetical protein